MKNVLRTSIFLLVFLIFFPVLMVSADTNTLVVNTLASYTPVSNDMRGLWVATVVNIDYPSKATTDAEILKSEAIKVLEYAKDTGFNAVFLQVRPTADALYKSNIFPWSKYLTGSQGMAPQDNFDPLEFWVTEAHKRGIELHAWINPYRITKRVSSEPKYDFTSLDPSNSARLHPNWVVQYSDGNLYFNPGIPEVRKLIIDGVLEIIGNYGVDGIHFDDYFYPGKDFNDQATYVQYGTNYGNIDGWRRANVDSLISDLSGQIKATGKNISFGISPFGIWANKSKNSLGSDTKGMESYYDHYADTRKWVKNGLLDYIAPQIYWNIGFSVADYSKLLAWWTNAVSGTGVDLYIGQAAYRSGNADPASAWYGVAEIEKQMKLNAKTPGVQGSIFFNYKSLADIPALSAVIKANYEQRDGMVASIPVSISRPSGNIRTSFESFYLNGSSDPNKLLYLNGALIEGRSKQGFFGILVSLKKGDNIFTISQEASYVTRVIYRESAPTSTKMSTAEITSASTFPQSQEYRTAGEKITLSCMAPIGAKVTVKLGGKTYAMKPSTTTSSGSGVYGTTFTYVYTLPAYSGTPRNVNLGSPVYAMTYKGMKKTRTAPAKIGVIMKNSPFYAKVTKEVIDTYQTASSANGAAFELYKGMVEPITGMTGSYIRLFSGQWVKKGSVETYTAKSQLRPEIKKAAYSVGVKWDALKLTISSPVAAIASFDGTALKLNISTTLSTALPVLPDNSLFSSVAVSKNDNKAQYTLTLKENQRLEGYYIEKTTSGLTLNIKRSAKAQASVVPLTGITIMLDPGHGGSEVGAMGPMGLKYPEKTINLNTAIKLQAELLKLGAKVLMTRITDKTMSLEERLAASRNAKPDMFLSLHANAMEDNVDMTRIEGFSMFYREMLAQPLAESIFNDFKQNSNRNNQGIDRKNFYVIRGKWTPSILFESGFVPNPNEFEWLTDENDQTSLAKSMAQAITKYFQH